jgi:hypothetical protein
MKKQLQNLFQLYVKQFHELIIHYLFIKYIINKIIFFLSIENYLVNLDYMEIS